MNTKFIIGLAIALFSLACQNSSRESEKEVELLKKELELAQRELELRERELAIEPGDKKPIDEGIILDLSTLNGAREFKVADIVGKYTLDRNLSVLTISKGIDDSFNFSLYSIPCNKERKGFARFISNSTAQYSSNLCESMYFDFDISDNWKMVEIRDHECELFRGCGIGGVFKMRNYPGLKDLEIHGQAE